MFVQPWTHNENAGSLGSISVGQNETPPVVLKIKEKNVYGVPTCTCVCTLLCVYK